MVLQPLLILVLQAVCLLSHNSLCLVTKPSKAAQSGELIERVVILLVHEFHEVFAQVPRLMDAPVARPTAEELDERTAIGCNTWPR